MRIALAVVFQLTNTFSREPTGIDSFIDLNARELTGLPACDPYRTQRFVRSLIDASSERAITVDSTINLVARAAGSIDAEDMIALTKRVTESLARDSGNVDVVLLLLSGAMTKQDGTSADLTIIEAARRAITPDTPIVTAFSQWANLDDEIVRSTDLAVGVDLADEHAVERKAQQIVETAEQMGNRKFRPVTELRKLRILTPQQTGSATQVMGWANELATEFGGRSGVLDVSVFSGFPFADVKHAGMSVSVSTDDDYTLAARLAERLQRSIWDEREAFAWSPSNVEIAVHDAMLSASAPIVIADAGDDLSLGAAGDGTGLLWALIDLGAPNAALGVIVDPTSITAAIESGVATEIKLDVGGSLDRRAGYPVNVTARIRRISDGRHSLDSEGGFDVGRAVLLDVQGRHGGQIDLILTERAPIEINAHTFAALGVDLASKKIVGIKRSSGLRDAFREWPIELLVTSTPGITTPLLRYFDWKHLPRPIYPLDEV